MSSSCLTHFQCSACGEVYSPDEPQTTCRCGKPLLARYDLERAGQNLSRDDLARRGRSIWRYRELLPPIADENVVTLGEGMSPLLAVPRLARELSLGRVWVKDEGQLPTGSFKCRGLSVAVSLAKQYGLRRPAIPSAGNAAGALAAYAARAGMSAVIFMPQDVPEINRIECEAAGAHVFLVPGLITDAGRMLAQGKEKYGWHDVSTLKEPGRIEGKKTMGYEIVEQLGWRVPDVIIYPTGGGTGLIGMWKAFDEMERLGWIGSKRPRMVAVQAEGCAPIVQAFEAGLDHAPTFENAKTRAAGIRVPKALGDFLILRALRESGGLAVSVSDEEMVAAARELFRREGIIAGYEGAAAVAALAKLAERGDIGRNDRVVVFNTGSGYKSPEIVAGARATAVDAGARGRSYRVGSFQEVEALLSRRERDGGRPGAGSGTAGSDPLHVRAGADDAATGA